MDEMIIRRIAQVETLEEYKALLAYLLQERKRLYVDKFDYQKLPQENGFILGAILEIEELNKILLPQTTAAAPTVRVAV